MADARPPGITQAVALELVDRWLTEHLRASSLDADALLRWSDREIIRGWRFTVEGPEGPLTLDLLVDDRFPRTRPRLAWVNAPAFPSIPHVEDDGLLCIFSPIDEFNRQQPVGIVQRLLGSAAEIFENGFAGLNREDFRSEFLSYWNPTASGKPVRSLLDPSGPSRRISVWRGKTIVLAAENSNEIRRWLANVHGKRAVALARIEKAPLIWSNQPLLPESYPSKPADLHHIVALADENAAPLIEEVIVSDSERSLVILGSDGGNGGSFAAVEMERSRSRFQPHKPRVNGFREGRAPAHIVAADRRRDRLTRSPVERADAGWVHGRDGNTDLPELLSSTVGVIGCGSLGSPLARLLAQAGVGELRLIDGDQMNWPNVGRHALGAQAVGERKATALAKQLGSDFPHLQSEAFAHPWQQAAETDPRTIMNCDLLISSIGSWAEEGELNEWLLEMEDRPTALFGWSEPYGCAGHAVALGSGSGCLACGLSDFGEVLLKVVEFSGETLEREPGCGTYFQPYGAAQIMLVATVIADLAIDLLCDRVPTGVHRMVAAREPLVTAAGGRLTDEWIDLSGGRLSGGNVEERTWKPRQGCPVCGGQGF